MKFVWFPCWSPYCEQKKRSKRWTFCINTTHNWFKSMTRRFPTSCGKISSWLDERSFRRGRKNGSWTKSWCLEWLTRSSKSFNCSSLIAFEKRPVCKLHSYNLEIKTKFRNKLDLVIKFYLSKRFLLNMYSRHGAGAWWPPGSVILLQLCSSTSSKVTMWSKCFTTISTFELMRLPSSSRC